MPTRKPPNAKEMADLTAALRERLGKKDPGAKRAHRPPSSTAELLDSIEKLAGSVQSSHSQSIPCPSPDPTNQRQIPTGDFRSIDSRARRSRPWLGHLGP
jgi:hypothetical protein